VVFVGVDEFLFDVVHEYIGVWWSHFGPHGGSLDLLVVFVHEIKVVAFEYELKELFDDWFVRCGAWE
jgi:hypothetical protein